MNDDTHARPAPGQTLAVIAEALFLANLLILPVVALAVLFWLWCRRGDAPPLARAPAPDLFRQPVGRRADRRPGRRIH